MKATKSALYLFATVGLSYLLLQSFSSLPVCESDVIRRTVSPDNRHEAKVVVERCNDQSRPQLKLSISKQATPKKSVSVSIGAATTTDVDITWLSESRLQFFYPTSFMVTQEPSEIGEIEIRFLPEFSSNSSLHTDAPRQ